MVAERVDHAVAIQFDFILNPGDNLTCPEDALIFILLGEALFTKEFYL
jgi:hypothetical protein